MYHKQLTVQITAFVKCKKKNKSDTSNNRRNWNIFKIVQKIPDRSAEKQVKELQITVTLGTAYCGKQPYWALYTAERTNVQVHDIQRKTATLGTAYCGTY